MAREGILVKPYVVLVYIEITCVFLLTPYVVPAYRDPTER
jgi:hypothetical protein